MLLCSVCIPGIRDIAVRNGVREVGGGIYVSPVERLTPARKADTSGFVRWSYYMGERKVEEKTYGGPHRMRSG